MQKCCIIVGCKIYCIVHWGKNNWSFNSWEDFVAPKLTRMSIVNSIKIIPFSLSTFQSLLLFIALVYFRFSVVMNLCLLKSRTGVYRLRMADVKTFLKRWIQAATRDFFNRDYCANLLCNEGKILTIKIYCIVSVRYVAMV